jgi:hypothetical protein
MTPKEAFLNKELSPQELGYRIGSWGIYGERAVLLFFQNFEISSATLNTLLNYLATADKLVLALPKNTSAEMLFKVANLQAVDAIVVFDDYASLGNSQENAHLAFEGFKPQGLDEAAQQRVISL